MARGIRRSCWLAVTFASAALAPVAGSFALEPDKLFEKVSPSVLVVRTLDAQERPLAAGSGVVIARGKVVTNCQLLARASRIQVRQDDVNYGAELEYPDVARDLCQLNVRNLPAPPIEIGSYRALRVGQPVYAVGSPRGTELSMSEGIVSSLREADADAPRIETTAAVSRGTSGGGLFDADGRLVGITTAHFREAQAGSFAIPADWLREVPERGQAALARRAEQARAAAAATTAGPPGLPPIDASLPKQMPQVGDTWTYAIIDARYKPSDRSRKQTYTVRSVTPTTIVETAGASAQGAADVEFRNEMVANFRTGVVELAPYANSFRELKPGERFGAIPIRGIEKIVTPHGDPAYQLTSGQVLGKERVSVPAGSFDATRVEFDGKASLGYVGGHAAIPGSVPLKLTAWYAPETKRVVRIRLEGGNFTEVYELESYKLR